MIIVHCCFNPSGHKALTPHVSGETASSGHPQLNISVLIHHHQRGLSVYSWPLQHRVILPTDQVKVQASVVPCVIAIGRQGHDADAVTVAFRAVETGAVDNRGLGGGFHDLGEVLDPPHGVGAARLGQADVVNEDATSGARGVTAHSLESVAEFHSCFQWDVGDLPRVVRVRCVTRNVTTNCSMFT